MNAYHESIALVSEILQTNIKKGLSVQTAANRLRKDGPNIVVSKKQENWFSIFIHQFQSPLIYILLVAAIIIFFVGEHKLDAFIISGILFFNALIGTVQEGRTSNIIASLGRFLKTKSVVIRDGKHYIVEDKDLVVGDLIVLKAGERIPADARIIQAQQLQVDESTLTGESMPVDKVNDIIPSGTRIYEQKNMAFKGTYIIAGSGLALVVATGKKTQIGMLQTAIEDINTDIPLKRELNRLSYIILVFILVLCALLLAIGMIMGRPFKELLVMLTALFICVIPEGLPVVLTLILVTGAYRMARNNVLVKNLQGVEALGRTDVIIIDKTGTLTRNEMMVTSVTMQDEEYTVTGEGYFTRGSIIIQSGHKVHSAANPALQEIGIACSLLNSAEVFYNEKMKLFEIKGDPTEAALGIFAQKMGFEKEELLKNYVPIYEIPFDARYKFHAAFFKRQNQGIAYVIGAPEALFDKTIHIIPLLQDKLQTLVAQGLRVVAIGKKSYDLQLMEHGTSDEVYEYYQGLLHQDITILGICGIQDTIRPEVKTIIEQARAVGLHVVMATGDHKQTAEYIARNVGIFKDGDLLLDGESLQKKDDAQLLTDLEHATVFARVSPQDKERIVTLFHQLHKVVAMTGDGVNDVPSLVAADLGIAMGGIGTEVAKQAADLVLLDDSFTNIVKAIEQGRHIFYTLRRVMLYFFATNMGEIFIVLFALFTRLPLPLTAAQILWLNLVTDGFLDIGLSMEPQEADLLQAEWLKKKLRLIDFNLLMKTIYLAIPMGIASLVIFYWAYRANPGSLHYARTMALIAMAMFQWFNAWNCRSEGKSLLQIGIFSNKWLVIVTLFVFALQLGVVYIPFMQYIFKTVPLALSDWLIIICISAPIVILEETRKAFVRRWFSH